MIGILLAGALAAAQEQPDLEYQRLFGAVEPASAELPADDRRTPWWPVPAALAGLGLLFVARRRMLGSLAAERFGDVRVMGRTSLGGDSGLCVVEVTDSDRVRRRFLIGTGSGPPALLADLGERESTAESTADIEVFQPEPSVQVREDPAVDPPSQQAFSELLDSRALPTSVRMSNARALVDELLQERRAEEEQPDEPPPGPKHTFRGVI